MHELILHASIPSSRHDQMLSVLAGVAAMQPILVLEKHLIFKPSRPPSSGGKAGPQQGQAGQLKALQGQMHGDLFYLKLVQEVKNERGAAEGEDANGVKGEKERGDVVMGEGGTSGDSMETDRGSVDDGSSATSWTLQFRDLPDPNKGRPVTSRAMADMPIVSGDPVNFMAATNYTHTSTLLVAGHRLTHSSILLQLFRSLIVPGSSGPDENPTATSLAPQNLLKSATPLDASGAYILQASLRVYDGQKVDRMQQGTTELLNLKEMLKGAVDLEMADRLGMDTRVR